MAQSAVSAVVGSVSGLAVQETSLLCGVKDEVVFLKEELARLQGLLKDLHDKPRPGHATSTMATSVRQIKDAVEDAENVIEDCEYMEKRNRLYKVFMGAVTRYAVLPCDLITLHKVGVEVRRIRRKIFGIKDHMHSISSIVGVDGVDTSHTEDVDDKFTLQSLQDDSMTFVGFTEEYNQIVEKLLQGGDKLSALSIVGIGDGGKTTIARKILKGPEISEHFAVTIWVSLPQKFSRIDILKHIYNQIVKSSNNIGVHNVNLEKKIYELLIQKKYLLVLDGVWEEDTWSKINTGFDRRVRVFPDANTGSRVLLTTRNVFAATQTEVEMPTDWHALALMDDEAAWKLLITNASQSSRRPKNSDEWGEFEKTGKELVAKCAGLPLAIAVLGKYLAMNLDIQKWRDILEYWTTITEITGEKMMNDILGRSYNELPSQHLKMCFLYIAAFPGNYVISVSGTRHSQEQEAHKYVAQLAQRSMVQVVKETYGTIEQIRIHDILGDWCIEKAINDDFLDVIDKTRLQNQDGASSSKISLQSFYDDNLFQRRGKLRSLLGFNCQSISLPKLRYLRILHIEDSSLKNLSLSIVRYVHLRYLCLRRCEGIEGTERLELISSIGQLLYLQTIDLRETKLHSAVPPTLWDIPDLRHVYLEGHICAPKNDQHKELQTLYLTANPFIGKSILKTLEGMPNLIEIFLHKFDVLDKLPKTQSFPQRLQKLHLFANALRQDPMPILEKLPGLVVLELWGCEAPVMSCSPEGFPQLKVLKLGRFFIKKWLIKPGAMKVLSNLALEKGVIPSDSQAGTAPGKPKNVAVQKTLMKLPKCLLHLQSLEELKLVKMPKICTDDLTYQELCKACKVITG